MASFLTRNLIPSQTQDIQFQESVLGAEGNVLKPHKKSTTLGGKNAGTTRGTRKPLQDLNNRNNYGSIGSVDTGSSKANKSFLKNENVFKPEEKVQKTALARKPLGDLTNSKKPQLKDALVTKKNNMSRKASVLKEDKVLPNDWIAEEGFLHNHKECEAQRQAMSMEYYLELIGLRKELTPLIVEYQLPPIPPTSPKGEISWEYDSLPGVASPRLSFSPPRSPLIDWGDMGSDFDLMASLPRN